MPRRAGIGANRDEAGGSAKVVAERQYCGSDIAMQLLSLKARTTTDVGRRSGDLQTDHISITGSSGASARTSIRQEAVTDDHNADAPRFLAPVRAWPATLDTGGQGQSVTCFAWRSRRDDPRQEMTRQMASQEPARQTGLSSVLILARQHHLGRAGA